jgi:amidase
LPDKARDKLAAHEHDFLTSDLSHRALQARGMPEHAGFSSAFKCLRQEWARFSSTSTGCFARPPPRDASRTIKSPIPHARSIEVNGDQRPYFDVMLWACSLLAPVCPAAVAPAMRGGDGMPGVQIVVASFDDRTAIACAAMLEALGARFRLRRWT